MSGSSSLLSSPRGRVLRGMQHAVCKGFLWGIFLITSQRLCWRRPGAKKPLPLGLGCIKSCVCRAPMGAHRATRDSPRAPQKGPVSCANELLPRVSLALPGLRQRQEFSPSRFPMGRTQPLLFGHRGSAASGGRVCLRNPVPSEQVCVSVYASTGALGRARLQPVKYRGNFPEVWVQICLFVMKLQTCLVRRGSVVRVSQCESGTWLSGRILRRRIY